MLNGMMNPATLRTFLTVEKHLNYTHAARELLLSQPAVSRQIRQLERELGVRLFEQLGKRLYLTDAGKTLSRGSSRFLGGLDRIRESLAPYRDAQRGSLRLGASTTPGLYLLPPVLGRFHGAHPDVDIAYRVENSRRIEDALLANEIDLGFVGTRLANAELVHEPVADDEIVFFAAPSHPLAARKRLAVGALRDASWVAREQGSATRKAVEGRLQRSRVNLAGAVVLSSPEAVKALVAGGFGISFLSIYALREDMERGKLVKLPLAGFRVERKIHAVRHKDKKPSAVMTSFMAALRTPGKEPPGRR